MRRLALPHRLASPNSLYFNSTDHLQLYGRLPTAGISATTKSTSNVVPADNTSEWRRHIDAWEAELYANPSQVSAAVRQRALRSLRAYMELPRNRNVSTASDLWLKALVILKTGSSSGPPAAEAVAECAATLFASGRYEEVLSETSDVLLNATHETSHSQSDTQLLEYHAYLRLASFNVMSSLHTGRIVQTHINNISVALLQQSKHYMSYLQKKEARTALAGSVELLLWSYDWYWAWSAHALPAEVRGALVECAPQWLRGLFQDAIISHDIKDGEEASRATPASLRRAGAAAAEDKAVEVINHLYDVALRREKRCPDFSIFGLSVQFGNALLQLSPGAMSHKVMPTIGTSVYPANLILAGNSRRGFNEAVTCLTKMKGAAAYEALRSILLHSAEDRAAFQERTGDILTGVPESNWRRALDELTQLREAGSPAWREQLPTTLRLLSDAAKFKQFFELLPEYDAVSNGGHNLSVAASLAQALRLTGKSEHYMDVIDLVASSDVPTDNNLGDMFLRDACIQLLYCLRDGKKWEEALTSFSSLKLVMPPQATRVLASMLCDMPESSPWLSALEMVQHHGDIPNELITSLQIIRGVADPVQALRPNQKWPTKHLLHTLKRNGKWKALLNIVTRTEGATAQRWVDLLRAVECTTDNADTSVLTTVPAELITDFDIARQLFVTASSHGWLEELSCILKEAKSDATQQVSDLVHFAQHGSPPPNAVAVSDSYIGHCYTSFVSALDYKVRVHLQEDRASNRATENFFRVPAKCVGATPREKGCGVFLRPYPSHMILSKQILYSDGSIVVAHKPSGSVAQSTARGVLKHLRLDTSAYRMPYIIPSESEGLFILQRATESPREVTVRSHMRLNLVPLSTSSPPIMAADFFEKYDMCVADAPAEDGGVVVTFKSDPVHLGDISSAMRSIHLDINGGGWTWTQNSGSQSSFLVNGLDVTTRNQVRFTVFL